MLLAFSLAIAAALPAQTLQTVVSFNSSGGYHPYLPPSLAPDGTLYGTTYWGGTNDYGTVFKLTPSGTLTTLADFCIQGPPNCEHDGFVIVGSDGNVYGTDPGGGDSNGGTFFEITSAGVVSVLYNFCSLANCADGSGPGVVLQGSNGNFYGVTAAGGTGQHSSGTVFQITPSGVLTTIYNFCSLTNCADGSGPLTLVEGSDGNFYGATGQGATNSDGTVFQITPSGTLTTLYRFCSLANCVDGQYPAGLIQATNGNLYGTTNSGGTQNRGTVFQLTPSGTLKTLHNFCSSANCADGNGYGSYLIQGRDGNFYGTTQTGGALTRNYCPDGCGTLFQLTPGGVLSTLFHFCTQSACTDGNEPVGIVQASDGSFYGTTYWGGD
jgi:uncharacterized repeat protein (TIGR03803 family)